MHKGGKTSHSLIRHLFFAGGAHTHTHTHTNTQTHTHTHTQTLHVVHAVAPHHRVSPLCAAVYRNSSPAHSKNSPTCVRCPLTFGSRRDLHSLYSVCLILPLLLLRHTGTQDEKREERREKREASSSLHPPLGPPTESR